ncbi:MAG: ferredoxin family protein [Caldilineaceae bacterium]
MAQPLPQITPLKCNGCGRCVEVCPAHVFGIQQGKAVLVAPQLCTYCMACEEICPTNAIALPFEIIVRQPAKPKSDLAKST